MPKQLRYWNGRSPLHLRGGHDHAYICAYSKAEAVRLAKQAFGECFSIGELNNYWSECWGTAAEQALGYPEEPGVYIALWRTFFKFVGKAND